MCEVDFNQTLSIQMALLLNNSYTSEVKELSDARDASDAGDRSLCEGEGG